MVIEKEGYIHLIEYLTANLNLFEQVTVDIHPSPTVMEVIEQELCEQIINVCGQNSVLTYQQRNTIIREVDAIVSDLEEVLSGVVDNPISEQQATFIKEFALLIKNLFDTEILSNQS
jgi:hypothetical protein